jgi:predicted RNA-binding Zn ribbon-like protein
MVGVTSQTGGMSLVHVAGNVALDFVGTVSERGTRNQEGLDGAATLAHWYLDAGLVDELPHVDEADLAQARQLREQVYNLVLALLNRTPIPERTRLAVNRIAREPGPTKTLGKHGHPVRRGDAQACLAAVAHAAVDLVDPNDGATLKLCADELCTHPFLDRSRAKARRWCDMETCGDRAKVRRYRAAQKAATQKVEAHGEQ